MPAKMYNQGDFVYLPSDTLLFTFAAHDVYTQCVRVSSPTYLMFLENNLLNDTYCNVLYDGEIWSVKQADTYRALEK